MTTLNWLEVDEIRLHEAIIRKPNDQSRDTDQLQSVRVAFDGAMVHINARQTNMPSPTMPGEEVLIHAVPASAIRFIRYRQKPEEL